MAGSSYFIQIEGGSMAASNEQLEAWSEEGHLVEIQQYDVEDIDDIFERADRFRTDKQSARTISTGAAGLALALDFYEPSTRTYRSFSQAAHLLGMHVDGVQNASQFSSAVKGETTKDSVITLNMMGYDAIVIRHNIEGEVAVAANASSVPVINAGDGAGQHPTQSLLDLFTIADNHDLEKDMEIVIGGDLRNGRTVRSLAYLLGKYDNKRIVFVSKPDARIGSDILEYLGKHNVEYEERTEETTDTLPSLMRESHVVYWTRTQAERGSSSEGDLIIDERVPQLMRSDGIIMHPLPRVGEITTAVDQYPQARYFEQMKNGVWTRAATLDRSIEKNRK